MSEQQTEKMSEQHQSDFNNPSDETESDRMAKAMQAFGNEELEQANSQVSVEEEQAQQAEEREQDAAQQDDRSEYYAKLVEKDREIRQLKSQLKGNSSADQPDLKALAKENPVQALQELGIGLDQILDIWAGADADGSIEHAEEEATETRDPRLDEIDRIKQELENIKKEKEQATYQQSFMAEIQKIDDMVNAEGASWDLIKESKEDGSIHPQGSIGLVMETAAEMYKLNSELPDYDIVLDAVESHLEEHYGNIYKRLSGIKKLQSNFEVKPKQATEKIKQDMSKSPAPGPTLSTQHSSETPIPRGLEEQERYERALSMLSESGD